MSKIGISFGKECQNWSAIESRSGFSALQRAPLRPLAAD